MRKVVVFGEQLGHVSQRRERRPELVRDSGDEILLQAGHGKLTLEDTPKEVRAPRKQQHDGDEPGGEQVLERSAEPVPERPAS